MKLSLTDLLLVESHDESRELAGWYLTKIGYRLTSATTCAAGLTLAGSGRFSLYLLGEDCEDGETLDLCRQIRAFDSETPILICSAWAFPTDCEAGIRAGAQAYLTKPCELDELRQTIEDLIAGARVRGIGQGVGAEVARMTLSQTRLCVMRLRHSSRSGWRKTRREYHQHRP
jgi:DNA-binding response OmpR family regulator